LSFAETHPIFCKDIKKYLKLFKMVKYYLISRLKKPKQPFYFFNATLF